MTKVYQKTDHRAEWHFADDHDALELRLGRAVVGTLHRSLNGVYAITYDGRDLGEYASKDEGCAAIEHDLGLPVAQIPRRVASDEPETCAACNHPVSHHRDLEGGPMPCSFETGRALPENTAILCGCREGA